MLTVKPVFLFVLLFACSAVHAQDWTDGSLTVWHSFGSQGTGDGQFQEANGIAVDHEGLIYVSDCQLHRIQVFQVEIAETSRPGSLMRLLA